jgi:hypothetical protein
VTRFRQLPMVRQQMIVTLNYESIEVFADVVIMLRLDREFLRQAGPLIDSTSLPMLIACCVAISTGEQFLVSSFAIGASSA